MEGKVAIVTGGSSGMGKAMAKKFAEKGAKVVITGRTVENLEQTKQEIQQQDGQVLCVQMDVRNPEDAKRMVEETKRAFGGADYLVNNAAGNFICPAEEMSVNAWNAVINIVLNGTWYCSQAVGREWITEGRKGSILNMLATYAWLAGQGVIHSASAKAGVLAMTRTLAVEWGKKYGIRVNAIAPGPIDNTGGATRLWESEEAARMTLESVPLGRLGQPEEIANLAYFLLSPEAEYINGECVTMDGGQWLNRQPF
ncbi:2,4-dienoyl-CoA reductase [Aneurinibacillus aneurinilyticus]|jgi:NAD(P)-dependent dehydrogenase (short-subunit alcohol dehydrogenase family)|uniref:2,4-dienoyl-CoA reductase n=2 Tax=Aneurinibacillus aneurinilyticus TaxID=1391 RepID=A0A848D185_ANEAE|nr:2,4-dienoyl-CoA reductase [Aneurinibacillus aneurinilyticus]ERI11641.1 putative peroxisomal trans-2-enoyl-CoA reductase [Aneurinibacillus aneurinilyticus ATCC 12856]MED0673208.1 2,4-dienoyl-CoA reductase [Aneurinibacillus aneurinilyticus]MED0706777.1 2,4-dienoyl-CoA reductase [Aneurinibacillus aneurinilyticus]MED0725739.1 2,4-dienoyl-CoA reductase [Aneurinibacillus aneurinilyticus]MED0733445.1 2,4-dienoyl-CoA reductase [Aneurinibacillus aneurinilyticus]